MLAASSTRAQLELEKAELSSTLANHLRKRATELEQELDGVRLEAQEEDAASLEAELAAATKAAETAEARAAELATARDAAAKSEAELRTQVEKLRAADRIHRTTVDEQAQAMERILQKRSVLLASREEATRKIRELGSLPGEAFDKYENVNAKTLLRKLHGVNRKLTKYNHVNKKALDQYISFNEQRKSLRERKAVLDEGAASIRELIDSLDERKDEAIQRTFKGVAMHFAQVFRELVPSGKASLVMLTDDGADDVASDSDDDSGLAPMDENRPTSRSSKASAAKGKAAGEGPERIRKYVGVAMKVSFTGAGETFSISQLSGGQKSVVALALIFAIQRTDPAPFYLFDEIDSALDAAHRTAVATLISKQAASHSAQFITTTFRPEMLDVAHQFYQVVYSKTAKVSTIQQVDQETAKDFIAGIMAQEA